MEITAIVKPSRALFVGNPFGLTFGSVGDGDGQRQVLAAMLDAAVTMTARGILDSGIAGVEPEMRARQLRNLDE